MTAPPPVDPSARAVVDDDRTTRARIRDAAMEAFAKQGFRGATVRGIAAAAGVSPGLVQHHFATKEALRDACDAHATATIRSLTQDVVSDGGLAPELVAASFETMLPVVRYLAVALADGTARAEAWFDELVAFTGGALAAATAGSSSFDPEDDLEAVAAVSAAMQAGLTVLYHQVARTLHMDPDDPALFTRITRARLTLTSGRLIDAEVTARAREGLELYERRAARAATAEPDPHRGDPP